MSDRMTPRIAVEICNGQRFASATRKREAWQFLHDTKLAYNLAGPYADTVRSMIADGMIEEREKHGAG